jgi:hypothetical protein
MTPSEYLQLKAFARIDGGLLALLWSASFACYIKGLQYPVLGITALLLMLLTPFYVAYRLKRFRDVDLNGVISLMRGWAFVALVFFLWGSFAGISSVRLFCLYRSWLSSFLFPSSNGISGNEGYA